MTDEPRSQAAGSDASPVEPARRAAAPRDRLAQALRDNLRRRKEQARLRRNAESEDGKA